MSVFSIISIFVTVAALASWVNHRYIRLPGTVGLMTIGLIMSLAVIGLDKLGLDIGGWVENVMGSIDFSEALMKGMLSFLLFAGAIKIDLGDLLQQKFVVSILATGGVVITTLLVGVVLHFALMPMGLELPFAWCLVFGALIAPTDPVAVLSILKSVHAPKSLEVKIAGESLFNDGVGVVVFMVMLAIAASTETVTVGSVVMLFLHEAVGGVLFGILIGWIAFHLLKSIDDYAVEVLITLALVCGGYSLATVMDLSGPIAIVVAGLLIGNYGRHLAMSETTRDHLDKFWELVDETLNAVLFIWIGLEILILHFTMSYFWAGLLAIPVVLAARLISVWLSVSLLRFRRQFTERAVGILTWGGLRGGISIALALSLAAGPERDLIVSITYVVVVFSILVQGLTIKPYVQSIS
ncbi:MAG TPA: sodium:proton antiporter [candidate division Zixibacteria bacterium]|nr:sodium:proton antiporter [candidate division Zixibacteria bacterium]